jgi:hypothetical protein
VAAGTVALALSVYPAGDRRRTRWLALPALLPAALPAAIAFAATGTTRTSGTLLKLLIASPYATQADVLKQASIHWTQLWGQLFAGKPSPYLVVYQALPTSFRLLLVTSLLALLVLFVRRAGRHGLLAFLVSFGFGCLFVVSPERARAEHVEAAREICEQQVRMAEVVRGLPPEAIVAINDAGAIAYLGGHRTWDMVGLTSHDAASSRLAGVGSVFERMERLPRGRRPTHLAYYHTWFPDLRIGGRHLFRASTTGIYVGSYHKDLEVIRPGLFDSGARPRGAAAGAEVVDELDVADLASEVAHGYEGAGVKQDGAIFRLDEGREPLAEGGRALGSGDRFELRASPGEGDPLTLVMRLSVMRPGRLEVRLNGEVIEALALRPGRRMTEYIVPIDAGRVRRVNVIERRPRDGAVVEVFHDWLLR